MMSFPARITCGSGRAFAIPIPVVDTSPKPRGGDSSGVRNTNSFIGSPVPRSEDFRFLRGAGRFIGDLNREGQWHAAVLRSTIAHGRLVSIDTTAAQAMPGIHAVITAKDIGR